MIQKMDGSQMTKKRNYANNYIKKRIKKKIW